MKLIKAMVTVGALTLLSRVAGFVRDLLSARILGAGPIADAFFIALKLPNFFRRVTAEGAFSVSFVPLYTHIHQADGEEAANKFAQGAMGVMISILLPFTILCMIVMPIIMWLIAPGFEGVRLELATTFSRVTFPYLLMMSVTALIGGVLNAHDKFAPFAAAPIFFNMTMVICLLASDRFFPTAGHALAWGVTIAGMVQLIFIWLCAKRWNIILVPEKPKITPEIRKLFTLMLPGMLGAGLVQINLFADVMIASFLPTGAVSHLYYADRLNQLPLGTVGIAIGTALLPMLARAVAKEDKTESHHLFNRALEAGMMLALPAAIALAVASWPIITALFQQGAFTPQDAVVTANVLMFYAIGLPAYIAGKIFATASFARQDTKTPVIIAGISALSNVVLAVIFTFGFRYGAPGIACATAIAGWIQLGLMARILNRKNEIHFDDRFRFVFPRIIVAAVIMGVVAYTIGQSLHDYYATEGLMRAVALLALVGSGGLVYLAVIFGSKAMTMQDLKNYFIKKA
ncbi:MAG TPA: murein biosynthesis integral membrane protein MurJ [Alphaproteobacteria bacterium]